MVKKTLYSNDHLFYLFIKILIFFLKIKIHKKLIRLKNIILNHTNLLLFKSLQHGVVLF